MDEMETLNLTQDLFTRKSDWVLNTYSGSDLNVAIDNQEGNEVDALTGNDKIIGTAIAVLVWKRLLFSALRLNTLFNIQLWKHQYLSPVHRSLA